jgi:hypothetical protein
MVTVASVLALGISLLIPHLNLKQHHPHSSNVELDLEGLSSIPAPTE